MTDLPKILKIKESEALLKMPLDYTDYRHHVNHIDWTMNDSVNNVVGYLDPNIEFSWRGKSPIVSGVIVNSTNQTLRFSIWCSHQSDIAHWLGENVNKWICVRAEIQFVGQRIYLNKLQQIHERFLGKLIPSYKVAKKHLTTFQIWMLDNYDALEVEVCRYIRLQLNRLSLSPKSLRELINAKGWTLENVIKELHLPTELDKALLAREIIENIMCLILISDRRQPAINTPRYTIPTNWKKYTAPLPYSLTDEQENAVDGVIEKINEGQAKSIILGDVGTGKTVVASLIINAVVEAGGRVVIMVPNVILGAQIYKEIDACWPHLNIRFLLSESEGKRFNEQGYRLANDLKDTRSVVIGTTAILHHHSSQVIDLLWVDEEQKMGVESKESTLITDGVTHLLSSSATCIPRTQAMMTFGMVSYFTLTKYHTPRNVVTTLFSQQQMSDVLKRTQSIIESGGKVLMVCTKCLDDDTDNASASHRVNAEQLYNSWSSVYGDKVELSHGGLSKSDNENALNRIKNGDAQILIATTIIEVGITIPNLMYVVVLNPENLGIVTIHQIRGRVARSGGTGYCDLLPTRELKPETIERLTLLENHHDGFSLALADLKLRGMGDIDKGENQSGATTGLMYDCKIDIDKFEHLAKKLADFTPRPA